MCIRDRGRAPQDVIARAGGAELVFEEQTPLVPLLNRAMALNEAYRIAAPAQLAQELAQVEAQLAAAQPAQTVPAQELPQAQRAALQEAAPLGPFVPQESGGTSGAGYAPSAVCTPQAPRRKKRGWKIALAVGLPLVLLRPVSGSAALAVGADLMAQYGADSLIGRTAAVVLGSTETTFYTISVYFGAAGLRRTRYAVPAALIADLTGFLVACLLYTSGRLSVEPFSNRFGWPQRP